MVTARGELLIGARVRRPAVKVDLSVTCGSEVRRRQTRVHSMTLNGYPASHRTMTMASRRLLRKVSNHPKRLPARNTSAPLFVLVAMSGGGSRSGSDSRIHNRRGMVQGSCWRVAHWARPQSGHPTEAAVWFRPARDAGRQQP
jgi:hypothetical protein